jgi:cell wall-associated NlpC family hydrolase
MGRPAAASLRQSLSTFGFVALLALVVSSGCGNLPDRHQAGQAPLPSIEQRESSPADSRSGTPATPRRAHDARSDVVLAAMNFLDVPYRLGGSDAENGFDCSGFTRHIFSLSIGLNLPRRADDQASATGLSAVRRDQLEPGDLVFFNTLKRTYSHVGIYIGDGKFIHAPRTGAQVRIEDIRGSYWSARFTGARRADALNS